MIGRRLLMGGGLALSVDAKAEVVGADRSCADGRQFGLSDVNAAFSPATGLHPVVATFYYQSWVRDPRRMEAFGLSPNFTEWNRVAEARPVASCEIQPKIPAWGHFEASDPRNFEREISVANEAGISAFMFTWIFGEGRAVQNSPLDQGFLRAANRDSIQFSLMWVNHDDPQAKLDYRTFDWGRMATALAHYTALPGYWRIDGKPVFGIYDYGSLLRSIGHGEARRRIGELKSRGLFLICSGDFQRQPAPSSLGFDAYTSYNALSFTPFARDRRNTAITYREAAEQTMALWRSYNDTAPLLPSCPVGWDNSARVGNRARMVVSRSAEQYGALIVAAKRFIWQRTTNPAVVFLSSWNEWAEDHYLLPDRAYGNSYLQAVKRALL